MIPSTTAKELGKAFIAWAWARHHNILSWYIRPVFFLPYAYFCYHHSVRGIAITVVGLATSMFWFPAPSSPSQDVLDALEAERQYLMGPWPWWKVGLSLLVPVIFAALARAFWQRSFAWGLAILNADYQKDGYGTVVMAMLMLAAVMIKICWTVIFFESQGSKTLHLVAAISGLALTDIFLLFTAYRLHQKHKRL